MIRMARMAGRGASRRLGRATEAVAKPFGESPHGATRQRSPAGDLAGGVRFGAVGSA